MPQYHIPNSLERGHVIESITQLKGALYFLEQPPVWQSSDGHFTYIAAPDSGPDVKQIRQLGDHELAVSYNAWTVARAVLNMTTNITQVDKFTLVPNVPLLTSRFGIPANPVLEDDIDPLVAIMHVTPASTIGEKLYMADLTDHAMLDNALYDLSKVVLGVRVTAGRLN